MTTMSSDLEEGGRPKLNLLDLPPEIKDQIYGYLVSDEYHIIPAQGRQRKNQGDDLSHLSILRVSKRANCETMQLLQRRGWFIYRMPITPSMCRLFDNAPTWHMKNVQIVMDHRSFEKSLCSTFRNFAGTYPLRRTCLILLPDFSLLLKSRSRDGLLWGWLELYFRYIKELTGFKTVVVQVNSSRYKNIQRGIGSYEEYSTRLLVDIIKSLGPALGPAMPCDSVQEEEYDLNFKFFLHSNSRLSNADSRLSNAPVSHSKISAGKRGDSRGSGYHVSIFSCCGY